MFAGELTSDKNHHSDAWCLNIDWSSVVDFCPSVVLVETIYLTFVKILTCHIFLFSFFWEWGIVFPRHHDFFDAREENPNETFKMIFLSIFCLDTHY